MSSDEEAGNAPESQPPSSLPRTPDEIPTSAPVQPAGDDVSDALERNELIARARTFLHSPQIVHQDVFQKRKFLAEKGLVEPEIDSLLRERPPQLPTVPPRTYPQLPPSHLPNLLLGLARIFSWVAGGSAVLIFIYHRFILPRIARTLAARHSLKTHHLTLLRSLTTSLAAFKESQSESLSVLPRPDRYAEPSNFSTCQSLEEVLREGETQTIEVKDLPPLTLLRCAILDFGKGKDSGDAGCPTTEELFQALETKIPWLVTEGGIQFEHTLWETLSTCPIFESSSFAQESADTPETASQNPNSVRWNYVPPKPQPPSPLLVSLTSLQTALPKDRATKSSPFQHTLTSLADFTGYISSQVYVPYRPPTLGSKGGGLGTTATTTSSTEEEVKKEIRALKGLVLNRRSFMPMIPRAGSLPHRTGQ